jgi:eukaryotic-like serine/threonine-protein kinase
MPSPANVSDFLVILRQSGLVEEAALSLFLQQQTAIAPADAPAPLAKLLVCGGLLTPFQAEQLLQGKWRRFEIGRYVVMEQIGAGSITSVYLCQHKYTKRKVAVKVLPARLAADPSGLALFHRYARLCQILDHPNIARIYDIEEDDGLLFLSMEYVGDTLEEIVRTHGPLSARRAMRYMRQAASALQYIWELRLINRNIRPSNLAVDLSGTVKILDMGLARFLTDDFDEGSTRWIDTLGAHLAPETAADPSASDIRTDIYGLGCTFYFCLTGRPPFSSLADKLLGHQTQEPRPVLSLRPDVPKELVAIIDRMMANRPGDRFQQPAEVMRMLGHILAQTIVIDPACLAWNNCTVMRLAQAIHDERAFDRLPVLADALEDAGCHDEDILWECRQAAQHVGECWVLDGLLGKPCGGNESTD